MVVRNKLLENDIVVHALILTDPVPNVYMTKYSMELRITLSQLVTGPETM